MRVRQISEIVDFIKSTASAWDRIISKTLLATMLRAELEAKKNAKRQFIGRNDRRLTGTLLNSIYSSVYRDSDGDIIGQLGVKNIPYGAIHEFGSSGLPGGVIKPVNAKKLWIPQHRFAGRMTPREFIRLKQRYPERFFLSDKVAGEWVNPKAKVKRLTPLFFLTDQVKMPERPYLRPALAVALNFFPGYLSQFFEKELD